MIIKSLRFFSFRNLVNQELEFSSGINLLHGRNAQGKTNFVEAIQILGSGKSFRTSQIKECVAFGQTAASVFGGIHRLRSDASYELGVAIQHEARARYYFNGEETSLLKNFIGRLISVTFSPADLAIIQGSPGLRRKFVDRHMSELSPILFEALMKYNRALKSKQQLLKERTTNAQVLDPWNRLLANLAADISLGRKVFLEQLQAVTHSIAALVAPQDGGIILSVQHKGSARKITSADEWFDLFLSYQSKELYAQTTLVGPHVDDVVFTLSGFDTRDFASQGQARSLILVLKLGVIELLEEALGESPIVVLDDVNSELDAIRATNVFSVFLKPGRQIFATSTEAESGPWKDASKYEVRAGTISKIG